MKKKVINGLKVISLLLAIAIMIGLMPGTISVAQATTISNGGYPYGKNMGSSEITLVCEASGGSNYQWQVSDAEKGTYTNIDSATKAEYTFGPENLKWYRCKVDGTASKAVQAVKPSGSYQASADGKIWTNPRQSSGDYVWYLTNGKVAYTVEGKYFDVTGEYLKNSKKYMLQTSYSSSGWTMYGGDGSSAEYDSGSETPPAKIVFAFSDVAVLINVTLKESAGNFAFGCDTMLGNYDVTNFCDNAALVASLNNDKSLKHIAMVGAEAVNEETDPNAPAFVIEPTGNPMFWIGKYSNRKVFDYNTSGSTGEVKKYDDTTGTVTTRVESTDSGLTLSWKGVDSVQFAFKVGTAKETGAVSGNVNYLADTIDGLEANTVYTIEVKDSNGTTTATYTIKSDANGSIPLAGKDQNGTEYDLTGKKIVISKNGSDNEPATMEIEPRPSENNEQPGTTDYAKPEDITKAETEVTKNTITIIPSTEFKKNQQYRLFNENGTEIDGQEWMSIDETGRLTFTGLTEGTTYLIRAIIPATTTTPRSYISDGTAIQTISNAAAAIVTANNRTYDGTDQPLVTVNGGANGGTMYYAIGNTNGPTSEYTPSIPTATEVGTYYVWYKAVGDTDHIDSNADCVKVEILEPASVTVTYKVINGTWSDGTTTDITETVQSGSKPASVPTGMKAASGYTGGAWDTDPADATITGATTFTYTFTALPTYTVTYKVVNGTWSDGSTTDKTETVQSGSKPASVPTGMIASSGYTGGAWDTNPAEATITEATTFTYTFTAIPIYTVTVTNDGHGTGSAAPVSGAEGTEVTLTATPAEGYAFKEWQVVSGGVTVKDNKFTIGTANVEIKAVFEQAGHMEDEVIVEPGAPAVSGTNIDEVAAGVVTADEVAAGVKVWVDISPLAEAAVPAGDKALANHAMQGFGGTAGAWIDMSMFKQVDGQSKTAVHQTATAFRFSMKVSDSLKKAGRTFWLLRLHNDKADILATTTGDTLSGETNLFSTYLIAYKDAETPTPTPTPKPKKVPRTGDGAPLGLWIGLIAVGLIGLGTFIAMKRRTQKK